jgi:excisionase family DNA binding protein
MEKLFTVDDIAKMTMMTSRTIRNYIKEGLLKGNKIGGQWRFTEEDIKNLMQSGKYQTEYASNLRQDILDYIDGVNTHVRGEIQSCTIVDLYQEKETVERKQEKLLAYINANAETPNNWMSFSSEYIESENKVRVVIFAQPQFLIKALEILQGE